MGVFIIIGQYVLKSADNGFGDYATAEKVEVAHATSPLFNSNTRAVSPEPFADFLKESGIAEIFSFNGKGDRGYMYINPKKVSDLEVLFFKKGMDAAFVTEHAHHWHRLQWFNHWVRWAFHNCTDPVVAYSA